MQELLDNVVFIIVRPTYPGNIGAAARAMKNFGFSHLRLVEPPHGYKDYKDKWMAVGAYDLLENSEVFDNLSDALKDVSLAVATSSARRRDEAPQPITEVTPQLLSALPQQKVAFVFGNEQNGLEKDELRRCHHIATIPSNPDFPVLNLAQAVGIVAWEMWQVLCTDASVDNSATDQLSTGAIDDDLFSQIDRLLHVAGFTRTYNRDLVVQELRAVYQRMHPTAREVDLIKGALYKINDALELTAKAD
jgi:TrmH family RNA methyltransferase